MPSGWLQAAALVKASLTCAHLYREQYSACQGMAHSIASTLEMYYAQQAEELGQAGLEDGEEAAEPASDAALLRTLRQLSEQTASWESQLSANDEEPDIEDQPSSAWQVGSGIVGLAQR